MLTRESPRHAGGRSIVFALVIAEVISAFEASMIYAALPTLMREFGDPAGVGWVLTAYLLVGSVSAGLASRLGDLFGRRRVVVALLLCSASGSLISASSSGLGGLVCGRALQGMSAALLPLAIGIVREHLAAPRVPVAVGWLTATATFSAGAGLLLGGLLVDHAGWRTMFWFGAVHGAVAIVAVSGWVPASQRRAAAAGIDWIGGVLYAPAIAALLWSVSRLKAHGLHDAATLAALVGGVSLLAVWWIHEWRHAQPMIDVRRIARRDVGLPMSLMFLFGLGASQTMLVLMGLAQQPLWTGVGLGLSATMAGLLKLPSNFMGLFGAPWGGHLAARRGARSAALLGTLLIMAGWMGLTAQHSAAWMLVAWVMLASLGGAMLMSAVPNLLVEVVPAQRTSEFVGLSQVVRTLGAAIGTQAASVLLALEVVRSDTVPQAAYPGAAAYLWTMSAITGVCVVCWLVAWALPLRSACNVQTGEYNSDIGTAMLAGSGTERKSS
ncbi:MFS transporter [Piscinibacter sp. XHJ-5]|uniref:MFS transporter n=1 Tax=Piscinibacter sp. XHJ-5 TaxID=3037797 RepID=UPI002452E4C8|nr:MFS transporter [Piscinibacter sp. XHJ-5]